MQWKFFYNGKKMITVRVTNTWWFLMSYFVILFLQLPLSQYDMVMGAYHQSGNHWTLLVSSMVFLSGTCMIMPYYYTFLQYQVYQTWTIYNYLHWSTRREGQVYSSADKELDVCNWLCCSCICTQFFCFSLYSNFGNLQYVSGIWKDAIKWNVVTIPHYIQTDSVSCGVLTMKVCM